MSKPDFDVKDEFQSKVAEIKYMADKGTSMLCSMGSTKKMPYSLNELHFVPAQIYKIPLNTDEEVNLKTVIGPLAKKPLNFSSPIMFSGMSYGAVSRNVRLVLAKVASNLNLGLNSGEDFVLPEEIEVASRNLIIQYSTGNFRAPDDVFKKISGVEIRFGQGAFPGWESLLPAEKIPLEIAKQMGFKEGEAMHTPAHHPDIRNEGELREKIMWLKELTGGVPVGAKIGCGNVEEDVEILAKAALTLLRLMALAEEQEQLNFSLEKTLASPLLRLCQELIGTSKRLV